MWRTRRSEQQFPTILKVQSKLERTQEEDEIRSGYHHPVDGRNGREKEQREEGNRCIQGSIGNSGKDLGVKEAFMELTLTPPGLVAAIARSLLFPRCCASSDAFGQGKSIFRGADGGQYSYQYNVRYNDEFPKLIAEKTVTDIFCNVSVHWLQEKKQRAEN